MFFLIKTVEIRWNWRCKTFCLKIRQRHFSDKTHIWSIFPGARSEEVSVEKEEEESEDQAKLWYLCRSRRTFLFWLFADIFKTAWYISNKDDNGRYIDRQRRNIQYVTQHLIITSAFYANNICVKKNRKNKVLLKIIFKYKMKCWIDVLHLCNIVTLKILVWSFIIN